MNKKTRSNYINSPSPIKQELRMLFEANALLTIFDIGSCEGEDSIRYSRLFPNAKVFAFEPLPSNVKMLKLQLDRYGAKNVNVFQLALSDAIGDSDFYVSSGQKDPRVSKEDWDFGNKSSSLLPPHANNRELFPWLEFSEKIKVSTDTLEHFCSLQGVRQIDFVHLDVQGGELKVLSGAGSLINQITSVWMEVEKTPLYEDQPLQHEIENFMKMQGFVKLKDTVSGFAGDQFYVNSAYLWKHPLIALKFAVKRFSKKKHA
ncbi:MAG TPA: FkbM family methyltransferase [Anaerolineales bacterium]|nr:FkbM family methyltransferase [Anaerolineales bacterium]